MEVTDRVHIVCLGWEVARIVEPLMELKADKVVFIGDLEHPGTAEFEREMVGDLASMDRLEVETRKADLFDLDSALQAITQTVKDHEDDDVYINVSTGSNVSAIAGMMAAQSSEATPFYVHSSVEGPGADEVETPEEPIIPAAGEMAELPVFELEGPTSEQLQILAFLEGKEDVTKKDLINYAEDNELPFIADTEAQSDEGRYRLLESHIIEPLTEGGYVTVERAGRKKNVQIEDRGIDALAAFPLEEKTLEAISKGEESILNRWNSADRYRMFDPTNRY